VTIPPADGYDVDWRPLVSKLEEKVRDPSSVFNRPTVMRRYFPQLATHHRAKPPVDELTMSLTDDLAIVDVWTASAARPDEGATAGGGVHQFAATIEPHDLLSLTGGAIGQGIPLATGAAVACPERKVVCLEGDGSGMYTLQALWTQARESLDVTTLIFANRSSAILNIELARVGADDPGPKAISMLDLHNPELDWVKLASGMGVEASRATSVEEFAVQFESAMQNRGPRLIEVVVQSGDRASPV